MIDEERLKIAREVLADATKHELPASTWVFLTNWGPDLLDTLSAALKVVRAADYVIAWHKPDSIVGWNELHNALFPFRSNPGKDNDD